MKKRLLASLLSFVLLLTLLPMGVLAADDADPYEGYTTVNVSPTDDLQSAMTTASTKTKFVLADGTYTMKSVNTQYDMAFTGSANAVIEISAIVYPSGVNYTFEGVTVQFPNVDWIGFANLNSLTYKNCKITGQQTLYAQNVAFDDCTFYSTDSWYSIWTWGAKNVTFTKCTFNAEGKAVLVYGGGPTDVTLTDCTFNSTQNVGKAAVEIGNDYNATYTVKINNCTADTNFVANNSTSNLWGNKNSMEHEHLIVNIDGWEVTAPDYPDKKEAADAIDAAAKAAKDEIDELEYLSADKKKELKDEIDKLSEDAKETIKTADSAEDIANAQTDAIKGIEFVENRAVAWDEASDDSEPVYRINIEAGRHGEVTTKPSGASEGTTVTIYVEPDKGYELDELIVTERDGNELELKDMGDGRYRFQMPDSKVNIEASFKKAAEDVQIVLTVGSNIATVNGETVTTDVAPVIVNGRTMLPIRFIAEALGAEVEWVETERKVIITKGDTNIVIFIDGDYAYINGEAVKLDAAAFIEGNRTYLPLRFVAEALGADVVWDADARTVTVSGTK